MRNNQCRTACKENEVNFKILTVIATSNHMGTPLLCQNHQFRVIRLKAFAFDAVNRLSPKGLPWHGPLDAHAFHLVNHVDLKN